MKPYHSISVSETHVYLNRNNTFQIISPQKDTSNPTSIKISKWTRFQKRLHLEQKITLSLITLVNRI